MMLPFPSTRALSSSISVDVLLSTTRAASDVLDNILTQLRPYRSAFDAAIACTAVWALLRWLRTSRGRVRTTQLRGPPSESFLYGAGQRIFGAKDSGAVFEAWANEYGPVYAMPATLGRKKVILCDPKAIGHFYSKESWTYIQTPFTKNALAVSIGKGLLWSHGEDHKRQRKSLTPAFSVAAIRRLTWIFYDSAYKAKGAWDALIASSGGESAIIEVQSWLNHISLDAIGLAGFSHQFGSLEGKPSAVTEVLDTFSACSGSTSLNKGVFLLGEFFPFLAHIPTRRSRLRKKFNVAVEEISNVLLARTQKELEVGAVEGKEERSLIGLLIKGASGNSEFRLTSVEVMAQMKTLFIAGYETTSVSLAWTLLELSRNPDVQTKLRNELLEYGTDPTYDQLAKGLPYLDAVVHEIIRMYPPILEFTRIAIEDDIIPLSEPVCTKTGELVNSLTIAKGTVIVVPIGCMNRSTAIWGADAKLFRPSRWLDDGNGQDGIPAKAKEIQGHRHLLSFVDGPRMCLGKNFALTELKAVLAVLLKNFVFELRDGVDSQIETGRATILRPNVVGEKGCKLPLRVQPYVA